MMGKTYYTHLDSARGEWCFFRIGLENAHPLHRYPETEHLRDNPRRGRILNETPR